MLPIIKLFGAQRCHKTQHYQKLLKTMKIRYEFMDVEQNEDHAEQLRGLYSSRKLNFPTITVNNKKLRNPSDQDLLKWIRHFEQNN